MENKKRINSRSKGIRAELSFSHFLTAHFGIPARRGRQYKGTPDSPDVETPLPFNWEIKHVEQLNIYKAMDKTVQTAKPGYVPVVAHRRNKTDWHVTIQGKDMKKFSEVFMQFVKVSAVSRDDEH